MSSDESSEAVTTKTSNGRQQTVVKTSERSKRKPKEESLSSEDDDDEDDDDDTANKKKRMREEPLSSDSDDSANGDDNFISDDDDDNDEGAAMAGGSSAVLRTIGASKFSSALRQLLAPVRGKEGGEEEEAQVAATATTGTTSKLEKRNRADRLQALQQKRKLKTKKAFDMAGHTTPEDQRNPARITAERELKRIATRGVVALFNAVGTHQKSLTDSSDAVTASKADFMQMLSETRSNNDQGMQQQSGKSRHTSTTTIAPLTKPPSIPSAPIGWSVLQDEYSEEDEVEE